MCVWVGEGEVECGDERGGEGGNVLLGAMGLRCDAVRCDAGTCAGGDGCMN